MIEKSYIYKIYRDGAYLGNLPTPSSDFGYTWDINTAGADLTIACPISADVSDKAPPYLTTEDGKVITTEDGKWITTDYPPEIIAKGNTAGDFLFRNGNKVKVYEVSTNNPNGKILFQGTIERIEADFGGDNTDDQIVMLAYSDGTDLNNYVVPGSDANFPDQSSTSTGDDIGFWYGRKYGQSFITGSGITNLSAIKLSLIVGSAGPRNVILSIWNSVSDATIGATPLASSNIIVTSTTFVDTVINLPTPITVSPNTSYFFSIETPDVASVFGDPNTWPALDGANNSGYVGMAYVWTGTVWAAISNNYAFYFTSYFSDYTVDNTFTSEDPSTILKSVIDTYVSAGGLINYATGTVDLTGVNATYTFSLSTIFSAIQTLLGLAPFGFYWYVDVATNILYFKEATDGADIILTKGLQISSLSLVLTTENIVNLEYFSGGPPIANGPNLFKQYSDTTSIQSYGLRLGLQSDNRVIVDATADLLGKAYIAENKDEQYQTQVTILDSTMDTTRFKPGLNIGFNGFGTFVDTLVLQIVEIVYAPEQVTLTLGQLPPRTHQILQDAANAIQALQTIDNPSAPS